MRNTKLLTFSSTIAPAVFDAMPRDMAGYFGDNGGEPDGSGPYARPVSFFGQDEVSAAVAAGAAVQDGYEVDYVTGRDSDPFYGANYCGYQTDNRAYTTDKATAIRIQRYHDAAVSR